MILELGEGRELQLPDDMPDETARQLKRLVLACEERAAAAESRMRVLQDEMAALRQQFNVVQATPRDTGTMDAINALREELSQASAAICAAARADRKLVMDDFDEPVGTKAL